MRVKICGIKTVKDAKLAEVCGADALGILIGRVHASKDFVSSKTATAICRAVGPFTTTVLVTHYEDPGKILRLAGQVSTSAIQLHSDLSPTTIKSLARQLSPREIIAKVSVNGPDALHRARKLFTVADALLLDSINPKTNQVGGTGHPHNWTISAQIVRESPIPVILAGGLTPKNVSRAIQIVKPYGVDVNTGVKNDQRRKSQILMKAFVRKAKSTL